MAHRWTLSPSTSMLRRLFHNGMEFFMNKQIVYCLIWGLDSFLSFVPICIYALKMTCTTIQVAHRRTLSPSASILCQLFHNRMKFFMKKQIVCCLIWSLDSLSSCAPTCIYALKALQVFRTTCTTFTSRSSTELWPSASMLRRLVFHNGMKFFMDCLLFDLWFGLILIMCT